MHFLDFSYIITYRTYCNTIDRFLKRDNSEKLRLAFMIYDRNDDGYICQNDIFESLSILEEFDYFLVNDITVLCNALKSKLNKKESQKYD